MDHLEKAIEAAKEFRVFLETMLEPLKADDQAVSQTLENKIEHAIKDFVMKEYDFCEKIVEAYSETSRKKWPEVDLKMQLELKDIFAETSKDIREIHDRVEQVDPKTLIAFLDLSLFLETDLSTILKEYKYNATYNVDCKKRDFTLGILKKALARVVDRLEVRYP